MITIPLEINAVLDMRIVDCFNLEDVSKFRQADNFCLVICVD